jgi:hypothetical protein
MGLYGMYVNSHESAENFSEMMAAISSNDYKLAGNHATKLGINAICIKHIFQGFKNLYNFAKNKGLHALFGNSIKAGISDAQNFKQEQQKTKEIFEQVKKSFGTQIADKAAEAGLSIQAYECRIKQLCMAFSDPQEIQLALDELKELSKFQGIFTPKGLNKSIKFNLDHIFIGEVSNGKIGGLHALLESYKKGFMVHISHAEEDKTGIWRAIVNFNGKNKESTFFPKS